MEKLELAILRDVLTTLPSRRSSLMEAKPLSLDARKVWYAVSHEWLYKARDFIQSDSFPFLKDEIAEVYISDIRAKNGGIVDPFWFGSSRKKDTVVVATLFGRVGKEWSTPSVSFFLFFFGARGTQFVRK